LENQIHELIKKNEFLEKEIQECKAHAKLVLKAKQDLEHVFDAMPDMIAIIDKEHRFVRVNRPMLDKIGTTFEEVLGGKCHLCIHSTDTPINCCPHKKLLQDGKEHRAEIFEKKLGGHFEVIVVPYDDTAGIFIGSIHIFRNINKQKKDELERKKLHSQLLQAQKLESVGQLASGIAHEINTPAQFIGSNIEFLDEAFGDILNIVASIHTETNVLELEKRVAPKLDEIFKEGDWEYLSEEIPKAIKQSKEGILRVSSIVLAMKEFSHPGDRSKEPADLNHIITTTVTVARGEWKYVANVKTDFDTNIPQIPVIINEIGQVVLILLVNAAQTIAEKLGDNPTDEKGTITIITSDLGSGIQLRIRDTGMGIPKTVQPRIFDPFYTTKMVGKGTGQGLAIAHDVVTAKHDGKIDFTTKVGQGTEFVIWLPIKK
jgi:two-component system NtrC family sensor kinase